VHIEERRRAITESADAAGVVLLCFQPPGAFCHRRVFAEWWRERTGQPVAKVACRGFQYRNRYRVRPRGAVQVAKSPCLQGLLLLPGLDSNQQHSG
jgi:hypothetical protein